MISQWTSIFSRTYGTLSNEARQTSLPSSAQIRQLLSPRAEAGGNRRHFLASGSTRWRQDRFRRQRGPRLLPDFHRRLPVWKGGSDFDTRPTDLDTPSFSTKVTLGAAPEGRSLTGRNDRYARYCAIGREGFWPATLRLACWIRSSCAGSPMPCSRNRSINL